MSHPPDPPYPPDAPRPWTRFYHEQTAQDLPPLRWPHLPAYIDEAIAAYRDRAGVHALPAEWDAGHRSPTARSAGCPMRSPSICARSPDSRRRSHRAADAQLPRVSDRGLRLPQGGAGDGQHQPALHGRRDGAPVRRQRRRRARRDRRLRQQGGRGPAEDDDPHRGRRQRRRPAAAAEAIRRAHRAAIREEDGAAGHVRAHDVPERARAGRARASPAAPIREPIARRSRTTASPRCNTPAARPASRRARCSRTATCWRTSPAASRRGSRYLQPGAEVLLTALPLYHIFAFTANLMIFFAVGGRNILIPSPRPFTNLKLVMEREPVTWFTGINTLFIALMNEPWFQAIDALEAEGHGRRRHGARAGGGRALGDDDEDADLSGLRPHRNVAGRHAQSVSSREDGVDRRADSRHRRPARRRSGRRRRRRAARRAARARAAGDGRLLAAAGRDRAGAQGRLAVAPATSRRWTRTAICRSSIARRT